MATMIRMTREDPICWAWMPVLLERVYKFCELMDTETEPRDAQDLLKVWFLTSDHSKMAVWIAIDEGEIVAHMLATTEPFGSDRLKYILIRQAWVDDRVEIRQICKDCFVDIERWARSLGLSRICMLTHRNEAAMGRAWGFQPYKVMMYKTLGKPDPGG